MSPWPYVPTHYLNFTSFYGLLQIKRKNDQTVLKYGKSSFLQSVISSLMFFLAVEPPAPMVFTRQAPSFQFNLFFFQSQETGQLITTTIRDYDLSETSKLVRSSIHYYSFTLTILLQLRSTYMGIAMMSVMHLYFHFTQPLFIQALMGFKGLYDAKLVSIHILGKPAIGDLKRPFKVASMFGRKFFFLISDILHLYSPLI